MKLYEGEEARTVALSIKKAVMCAEVRGGQCYGTYPFNLFREIVDETSSYSTGGACVSVGSLTHLYVDSVDIWFETKQQMLSYASMCGVVVDSNTTHVCIPISGTSVYLNLMYSDTCPSSPVRMFNLFYHAISCTVYTSRENIKDILTDIRTRHITFLRPAKCIGTRRVVDELVSLGWTTGRQLKQQPLPFVPVAPDTPIAVPTIGVVGQEQDTPLTTGSCGNQVVEEDTPPSSVEFFMVPTPAVITTTQDSLIVSHESGTVITFPRTKNLKMEVGKDAITITPQ